MKVSLEHSYFFRNSLLILIYIVIIVFKSTENTTNNFIGQRLSIFCHLVGRQAGM